MSKDSVGPESPDKPRKCLAFSGHRWKMGERVVAETEGFEPSIPVTRYGSLAGSWFQPITPVSACRNEEAFTARGAL